MSSEPPAPASTGFRRSITLSRLPGFRRLAADYVGRYEALAPFYAGNPAVPDAWVETSARVRAHDRQRDRMADVLASQLEGRNAPAAAREAVERLRDPTAVAIVTGQQAGLLGGPLFTLLKALTTIQLAEQTAQRLAAPCVAIFWIDAEDHDWDEVRACRVLDAALTPQAIELPADPHPDHTPVGARPLPPSIGTLLDALVEALPQTEFTTSLIDDLRAAYAAGTSMAGAFARLMDGVLGSRGLIVFDAGDPAAKPLVSDIFVRELESPGRTTSLAAEAGKRLEALGYTPQVTPPDAGVALFRLDGGRHALKSEGDELRWGDSAARRAELVADAATHPDRYSPNVLLRPIVQDVLFPTVAYVAGPSELAYLGQLRGVYEHFGVPMPLMYPRTTATIVDAGAARFLQRYDVPFEDLQPRDEQALNRLLEAQLPPSVEASFEDTIAVLRQRMAAVTAAVAAVDPTLEATAESTTSRMEKQLDSLRGKLIQAAKRRDETMRRQFARTQSLAYPDGVLQERSLGFVYFLNQYGPAFVDRLEIELPVDGGVHRVITV